MAQEERALCLNRNVCPRLRMSDGEWWHICWLTDHRYHPPLPPHFKDEKTGPDAEIGAQLFRPHSSALTPCPSFPTGSEPKPCVQPFDSGVADSATNSSGGPWRPEDPDFSAMEDEQAGVRLPRWAGVDSSGASTLCLAPAFYQALCVQYFRELLKHSRVVIMPFHR